MRAEKRENVSPPAAATSFSSQNTILFNSSQTNGGTLGGCLGSLDSACIEKLLVHCAGALESNDVTLAQQVMWVLNNVASPLGDPNQRLTSWLLRALISRVCRICPLALTFNGGGSSNLASRRRLMSVMELAGYVDLIPWHRFGFCASNGAIFRAIRGSPKVHILDFSITHCMQWPTLIDTLAKRPEGPPSLRLTVPTFRPPVPPFLDMSIEEVGLRLGNFAKLRHVPFEFSTIGNSSRLPASVEESTSSWLGSILNSLNSMSTLDLREDEALIVNCQNWLRYLYNDDDGNAQNVSARDAFLDLIKRLDPQLVTVVDEDSDLSASSLTSRITSCFSYLWIPFDALETFLPKDSIQRIEYETDIGHKIENIIGFEGLQRIERSESGAKFAKRMNDLGFSSVPFPDETNSEVKSLLDEHASGWGMKRDGQDVTVLTWKGHNSVFATAWIPQRENSVSGQMKRQTG